MTKGLALYKPRTTDLRPWLRVVAIRAGSERPSPHARAGVIRYGVKVQGIRRASTLYGG